MNTLLSHEILHPQGQVFCLECVLSVAPSFSQHCAYVISSSLPRRAVSPAGAGTRPGSLGQTLLSTGNADLDRIFGGGVPLGCLLLLLEDGRTHHHLTLLHYFVSEGLNSKQAVLWAASQRSFASAKLPALNKAHGSDKVPQAHIPVHVVLQT